MTGPYVDLNDDDYWEWLTSQGVPPEEAHEHVVRRRQRNTEQRLDFGGQEKREAQPDFSGAGGAIGAAALKLGQGATFGLSDELSGDLEGARMALDAAQEQRPVLSTVSDIAGGLAVPVPGGSAIKAGGRAIKAGLGSGLLREAVKEGAKTGAALGGLNAFGRSEGSVTERLPATAGGVGSGAIIGGAFPIGLAALKETAKRIPVIGPAGRKVANRLMNEGKPSSGPKPPSSPPPNSPSGGFPSAPSSGAAQASAKVAHQIVSGERGPRGGALVSAKDAAGKYRGPAPKPPQGSGLDSPMARALAEQLNALLGK